MSDVEKISDMLPPKEEYDHESASRGVRTLASLYDLREIGVLANGEPEDGEQTWYLTETGVAWAEGDIELSLKELAQSEDVSEDDLYGSFSDRKSAEKLLQQQNFDTPPENGGENR